MKHRISYNDDFYKLIAGQLANVEAQGGIELDGEKVIIWLSPEDADLHNLDEDDTFQLGGEQQVYKVKIFKQRSIKHEDTLPIDLTPLGVSGVPINFPYTPVYRLDPPATVDAPITPDDKYHEINDIKPDLTELMKSEGVKADGDKPSLGLVPWDSISEIAKAFDYGAKKYATYNFTKGIKYMRLISAAGRHLWQYAWVEKKDPETGLSHLAHAGACVCMALWMEQNRQDLDDTYVNEKAK